MRHYALKFAQAQLVLNAFYHLKFSPFVHTRKPDLGLPAAEVEALRERIRGAKATVLKPGVPCGRDEYEAAKLREVGVELAASELDVVLVALSGCLAEAAAGNETDVRVVVGPVNEIEALARLLAERALCGQSPR